MRIFLNNITNMFKNIVTTVTLKAADSAAQVAFPAEESADTQNGLSSTVVGSAAAATGLLGGLVMGYFAFRTADPAKEGEESVKVIQKDSLLGKQLNEVLTNFKTANKKTMTFKEQTELAEKEAKVSTELRKYIADAKILLPLCTTKAELEALKNKYKKVDADGKLSTNDETTGAYTDPIALADRLLKKGIFKKDGEKYVLDTDKDKDLKSTNAFISEILAYSTVTTA